MNIWISVTIGVLVLIVLSFFVALYIDHRQYIRMERVYNKVVWLSRMGLQESSIFVCKGVLR